MKVVFNCVQSKDFQENQNATMKVETFNLSESTIVNQSSYYILPEFC